MVTIKITTKKKEKMSEHAEKALKHMGKLMQCIEELGEDDDMGGNYGNRYEGGNYGNRYEGGNYGNRYGNRFTGERDDEDDDDDYPMHERRRRSRSTGRYM